MMNQSAPHPALFDRPPVLLPLHAEPGAVSVRRIYCVGRNYVAHIREMGEGDERDPPFFFQKPTDAVALDGAIIPYPPGTERLEYEVELVAAIGRQARSVGPEQALDHVFGYAVGVDLTRRDRQIEAREQKRPWGPGKSFDRSAPCGALVRKSEVTLTPDTELRLAVNGALRQRTVIGLMIWDVAEIIARLSSQYTLVPGDLIFTGTPDGVGPLAPGDEVRAECDGLPSLSFTIGEPA